MFSKACQYGIKATLYIASLSQENKRVSLKEITKAIDSPEAFTAKILQRLAKNGIIKSITGNGGGFEIEVRSLSQLKLSQIVNAIDGDSIFTQCGLGLNECNELKQCPMHQKFKQMRNDLKAILENTDMLKLGNDIKAGISILKL